MEASGLACWFKDGRRLSILNAGEGTPALSFLIQQCTYREAEESGRCRCEDTRRTAFSHVQGIGVEEEGRREK